MRESPAKNRLGLPIPATACSFFPESSDCAKGAPCASTRNRPAGVSRMRNAPGLASAPFTTVASTRRPAGSRKGPLVHRRAQAEFICKADRLAFPIRDDIPVMLEEEARKLPPEEEVNE